ncbi:MAG: hypothetical protein GXO36_00020 [Chloroflexi bacterium]|nr:hypothetical protein [Chloroflexota bacterium]
METWTSPLSPDQWTLILVSPSADLQADFPFVRRHRELTDVVSPHEGLQRAYEALRRARGEPLEPDFMHIVLAEDLGKLYDLWSPEERQQFEAILQEGPQAQMVVWASARYEDWPRLPSSWRAAFQKVLYGPYDPRSAAAQAQRTSKPEAQRRLAALAQLRPGQALVWNEAGEGTLLAANLVGLGEHAPGHGA